MPVPTRKSVKDEIKKRYPNGVPKAETRDRSGLNRLGKDLNRAASAIPQLLFGEEGSLPVLASLVPGADLVDKLSSGKRPGILDMPGGGEMKALMTLTGIPLKGLLKNIGEHYLGKQGGEAFGKRLERLPKELQEGAAMTFAEKDSPAPGFRIPSITKPTPEGAGLANQSSAKSYYRDYGSISRPSNARNIWVRDMDPDAMAREFVGRSLGNAMPAELDKFSNMANARILGLPDNGAMGEQAAKDILSGNRKLFTDMGALGDAGKSGMLIDYLKKMHGNEDLRYVLDNAELSDKELMPTLNRMFEKRSGVPLMNSLDKSTKNSALIELMLGDATRGNTEKYLQGAMPKSVNELVGGMNADFTPEELFQLLNAGANAAGDNTLARAFADAGGLDYRKWNRAVMPNIMKMSTDRGNTIPLRKSFGKTMNSLQKTLSKDPRNPSRGKVSEFNFDFLK